MTLLQHEKRFTKVYQENLHQPIAIREARCLRVLFPALCPPIQETDLFAGRTGLMEHQGVGFSPDVTLFSLPHGMGYFYREDVFQKALDSLPTGSADAEEIASMMAFWREENTTHKVKRQYTPQIKSALPSDSFAGDVGVGFLLYRMTGGYENYETLVTLGIPGLLEQIRQKRGQNDPDRFYEALEDITLLMREVALYYADQAQVLCAAAPAARRAELERMAHDLRLIADHPPATLAQAIQLFWLHACLAGIMDYGRMDVFLGDFLDRDLQSGMLDEQSAQELLNGLWRMMVARKTVYHGRVVIGGKGRRNEKTADRFALMAMEASRAVHDIEPQLTLRLYDGMQPELFNKALEVIGTGATYPMLYNDDINIKAVMNAFWVDEQTAQQYVPFGCGEYIIDHRGFGSPNGVINMLKALEVTLFNGKELIYGRDMGLALGDLAQFDTFEAFYAAYKKQVVYFVEILADAQAVILKETAKDAPFLFMSLLYDGCIEKGRSMLSGGIDFLGATLESYGNINALDSLCAIRHAVYEQKLISKERLLEALQSNFSGFEKERRILLEAPKYGNDNPRVDALSVDLHHYEATLIRDQAQRVGLHSFLMVVINNSANTYLGRWTGASADGRLSKTFMANANNPVGGMDQKGVTATLNSLCTFPAMHHAGAVQNLKFTREMFLGSRDKIKALIQTYFDNGGTQLMITVVGLKDLEDALLHPEQYRSLLVRVGGFSARFVELEPDVQQEVLSRTAY